MVTYCGRFIKDLSTLTDPLRKLLKNKEWQWTSTHENYFKKIKESLNENTIYSYFDKSKDTIVRVDASPVGLGALLT